MKIYDAHLKFKGALYPRKRTDTIILHHAEARSCTVEDIHRWHQGNGWSGIGYHYLVSKDGEVWRGRPENTVGAHAGSKSGYNGRSIGICFEGDYMNETMTVVQLIAGQALIRDIQSRYGDKLAIKRHMDVCDTSCPGRCFLWAEMQKYKQPKQEDSEMVSKIRVLIDGEPFTVDAINKDDTNYIKLRDLTQAGYTVTYDAAKKMPIVTAPDTRVKGVHTVRTEYIDKLHAAGLSTDTVSYLLRYRYGDDLVRKLAAAIK